MVGGRFGFAVLGATVLVALVSPLSAQAAVGSLTYQGCITGNSELGPAGNGTCASIPSTAINGVNSGLDDLRGAAVSGDGSAVYAASLFDDALTRFDRNTNTGALEFDRCITGETESGPQGGGGTGACATVPAASSNALNSGLNGLAEVATSPTGTSVYALSGSDDAIAHFNGAGGGLAYGGCGSAKREVLIFTGNSACGLPYGSPTAGGTNSGFDSPAALTVSPDGEDAYGLSGGDAAVAHFDRNMGTGDLSFQSCLTAEAETGPPPGGTGACNALPVTTSSGSNTGFHGPEDVAVSADGKSVYVAGFQDAAIVRFDRAANGSLSYQGCITGEAPSGPAPGSGACSAIGSVTANGQFSGLLFPTSVAVSPDNDHVYVALNGDTGVAIFDRAANGALAYRGCVTGDVRAGPPPGGSGACALVPTATADGNDSGMWAANDLVISPQGESLYVMASGDRAVTTFDRDPTTGALTHRGCVSGDTATGPSGTGACTLTPTPGPPGSGVLDSFSLVTSPDGASLYAAARDGDSVASFGRQLVPDPAPGGGGGGGGEDGVGGDSVGPGPTDSQSPSQKLAGKRKQDVDKLKIGVTLDEAGTLDAIARVKVPKAKRVASRVVKSKRVSAQAEAGRKATLRFRFRRKALRGVRVPLADGERLKALIRVTATDAAGNASIATKRIRLTD